MYSISYHSFKRTLTSKIYDLINHLGNVLATVLDRKTFVQDTTGEDTLLYYKADVATAGLYYAFGSSISEMSFSSDTLSKYRFGFNGMERDNEISNTSDNYTTDCRQYESRLGRWFSTDPIHVSFNTPYQIVGEDPINNTDKTGATLDPKPGSSSSVSASDQGASINGIIYIRFDGSVSEADRTSMILKLQTAVNNCVGSMTYQGQNVTSNTKVVEYSGTDEYGANTKLEANANIFDVGRRDPNSENNGNSLNASNTQSDRTHGYLNYSTAEEDIGHEVGHILGLSDRYCSTVTGNGLIRQNQCPQILTPGSIPLALANSIDPHYDPQNNLMSGAGKGNLTSMQVNTIFSGKTEKTYKTAIIGIGLAGEGLQSSFNCVRITGNAIFGFKAYGYNSSLGVSPRGCIMETCYSPATRQSNESSNSNINCFYLSIFRGVWGSGDDFKHYIIGGFGGTTNCGNAKNTLKGNIESIKSAGAIR